MHIFWMHPLHKNAFWHGTTTLFKNSGFIVRLWKKFWFKREEKTCCSYRICKKINVSKIVEDDSKKSKWLFSDCENSEQNESSYHQIFNVLYGSVKDQIVSFIDWSLLIRLWTNKVRFQRNIDRFFSFPPISMRYTEYIMQITHASHCSCEMEKNKLRSWNELERERIKICEWPASFDHLIVGRKKNLFINECQEFCEWPTKNKNKTRNGEILVELTAGNHIMNKNSNPAFESHLS